MIVRCKNLKKGDGGYVDGCGWQGDLQLLSKCPSCGSSILRPLEKTTMKEGYEPKNLLGEMGQVCEEAGEVLQHFGKILRFGIDNVYVNPRSISSKQETNRQAFYRELDDLEACIKRIKARHAADPVEPLIPDPHAGLVEAMQEYLEVLDEEETRHALKQTLGVTRRGKLRALHTKVNALVGWALSRGTRP